MVRTFSLLAFFIFSIGATPFAAMLTLGSSNEIMYSLLIALAIIFVFLKRRIHLPNLIFISLFLSSAELISGVLVGTFSVNFARILASTLAIILVTSDSETYSDFIKIVKTSYNFIIFGFIITIILVSLFGNSITHNASFLSDPMVARKFDVAGSSFGQLLIFNFMLSSTPPLNIFSLPVLPMGTSSEPHMFFSFVLICMALLLREQMIGWKIVTLSIIVMVCCVSASNAAGLAVAGMATMLLYIFRCISISRIGSRMLILALLLVVIYLLQADYLKITNTKSLLFIYDRSIAETFAVIARLMSFEFGNYPLTSIPSHTNDYEFLPVNFASFALFILFMVGVLNKLSGSITKLRYVDIFIVTYVLTYSLKSFGILIFQPFMFMIILLIFYNVDRTLKLQKIEPKYYKRYSSMHAS